MQTFLEMSKDHVVHRSRQALVIIDMINPLDFPEGARLRRHALPVARAIARLKRRFKVEKIPVIYVNDNFGQWRADWSAVFKHCCRSQSKGRELARLLPPEPDDYFVLKPKHSAFYSTSLEILLREMGVKQIVLTGVAADICVLFSAYDAQARGYELIVPIDCVASETSAQKTAALRLMRKTFSARTPRSSAVAPSLLTQQSEKEKSHGKTKHS